MPPCLAFTWMFPNEKSCSPSTPPRAPEGLPLHVLLCDAVVHEGFVPNGVPGVAQGLCPELVGLEPPERSDRLASPGAARSPLLLAALGGRWLSPKEGPGPGLPPSACSRGWGLQDKDHRQMEQWPPLAPAGTLH